MEIKVYEKGGLFVPVCSVDSEYFILSEALKECQDQGKSYEALGSIKLKNMDEIIKKILKNDKMSVSIERFLVNHGFKVIFQSEEKKKRGRPKKNK